MPWELTGNAGTAPANNFLGTTDNQPLAVRTNGQERMTITPDGNVGIGTGAMPVTAKLHIEGAFEPLRVGDNNYYFFAGANRGGGDYVDIGAYHVIEGWKRLVLNRGGGNVGIGTDAPDRKLHVDEATSSLRFGHEGGPAVLRVENSGAASLTALNLGNDARDWQLRVEGAEGNKFKIFDATAIANRLTIDTSGNVGIGTPDPDTVLHVNGDSTFDGNTTFNGSARLPGGVWLGQDLTVRVPPVSPVPGELILGGIRTSISGFDGVPDDPPSTLGSPGGPRAQAGLRRGSHWIRTNGNEDERWIEFARRVGARGGSMGRALTTPCSWTAAYYWESSDARLKTNIRQVEGALDRLEGIRGVTFETAETGSPYALAGVPGETSIGVVAQEVEEVFPELVSTYDPDQEYKAVGYNGLTSVLIEAVKELKAQNEELRSRIEALERA
jgi:hypothetical protein